VREILNPKKPFLAIVAGAKYDTKIGPLNAMYKKVDRLILGGLIYNTFLCAKYGVKIRGVEVKLLHNLSYRSILIYHQGFPDIVS